MSNIAVNQARGVEIMSRMQMLTAMQTIVINLGGRDGMIAWLQALPDGVDMTRGAVVSNAGARTIAEDEAMYNGVVRAFARIMAPILDGMVSNV